MHHLLTTSGHRGGCPRLPSCSCLIAARRPICLSLMRQNIWPCSNNMNLHTFKEPVPALCVLILNKSKGDENHLLVAINSNRCQYCPFISSCQKCAVNT